MVKVHSKVRKRKLGREAPNGNKDEDPKEQIDNITDQITEQFDSIVSSIRDRIVDTNELVADSVTPYIPSIELGFVDRLPAPGDVVETTFDGLATQLEANRKFVGKIVDAWTPANAGEEADKVVKNVKTAAKKTTNKAKSAAKSATK